MSKNPEKSRDSKKDISKILILSCSEEELLSHFDLRCRINGFMYISPIFKYTNDSEVINYVKKDLLEKGLAGLIHAKENRYYDPGENCVVSYYQGLPVKDFYIISHRTAPPPEPED